ncbi:NUDIX domain-containing protein [Paenibacillus sp. JX-17]|uniref:NUDIX domain-containing protein n=1 Tax=Paenibacillus lacisoli TaxID=3064525 RepID=A0ABT9CJ75_9BACL|nr:NUDIX domain-containing protein [Paenibacillus sp. JX-17]MDO7907663.1 NUDIX domain-containing protein [Paenibacillus sp. JX-17]
MKLLKEIHDYDAEAGLKTKDKGTEERLYTLRKASRAVLLNDRNEIALLYVSAKGYHKLPGGGLEGEEDARDALTRELLEEAGVKAVIEHELGFIIEVRECHELIQFSYGYIARVDGDSVGPSFTEQEQSHGFVLKWVPIHEIAALLEKDNPEDEVGRFIRVRDMTFVKEFLNGYRVKG